MEVKADSVSVCLSSMDMHDEEVCRKYLLNNWSSSSRRSIINVAKVVNRISITLLLIAHECASVPSSSDIYVCMCQIASNILKLNN